MQDPTLQQQIREYEANMPPEILGIIKSFDWRKELRSIVTQNQVMIDVGSDLEESTYLMILGIVTVENVYDRLIEVHEYSEDKTKKILGEIEVRIFNQLSSKLRAIEDKEIKEEKESSVSQAYNSGSSSNSFNTTGQSKESKDDDSRDSILAEIEKEPEPTFQPKVESNIPVARPMEISAQGEIKNGETKRASLSSSFFQDSGVRKPFSMNTQNDSDMMNIPKPQTETTKPITGIQEDSMSAGFKNSTSMETKKVEDDAKPVSSSTPRAVDPYREPIE